MCLQRHAQILDHEVELVHVRNTFVIRTITGIESIGLKMQHMIRRLQNWGEVLVHLGQNLLLCHLLLQVECLHGLQRGRGLVDKFESRSLRWKILLRDDLVSLTTEVNARATES